jgi:hypothetical protein
MREIDTQIDRLVAAFARTSWRCDLATVDPALLARAEARLGALPADFRHFLSRVEVLENRSGDVRFVSARDLADVDSELARLVAEWRRVDTESSRLDAAARGEARAFWDRIVPFLCSSVNGDDFLALDRGRTPAAVIEAWGESGWSESARVCASSFTHYLTAFADVIEMGPTAFECGWRLGRRTIQQLHARDAVYREPLVPIVFMADFDTTSLPRRPTRPRVQGLR